MCAQWTEQRNIVVSKQLSDGTWGDPYKVTLTRLTELMAEAMRDRTNFRFKTLQKPQTVYVVDGLGEVARREKQKDSSVVQGDVREVSVVKSSTGDVLDC